MPSSARRRAMIAPPKPLPITIASKEVDMVGGRSSRSAADALFAHADVGLRVVAGVAPFRVMELNDVVAVVRADRLGEAERTDALPVVDLHPRQTLRARLAAVVRHADVEDHRSGRRRVARVEHVPVDFVAEIEGLPFDAALSLRP